MKFCTGIVVSDVITHAKFCGHQFRGFGDSGSQISQFSIDFHRLSLLSLKHSDTTVPACDVCQCRICCINATATCSVYLTITWHLLQDLDHPPVHQLTTNISNTVSISLLIVNYVGRSLINHFGSSNKMLYEINKIH